MITISWFDMICLGISVVSIFITILQAVRQSDLKKALYAQLNTIYGNLDVLCYNASSSGSTMGEIHTKAITIRQEVVGAIKIISKKEERYKTYDFGIEGESAEERIKKRKELIGIDMDGCIVAGQQILMNDGREVLIDDVEIGDIVKSKDGESSVIGKNKYKISNYILINSKLKLSSEHKVMALTKGWIAACDLSIGDEMELIAGEFQRIDSLMLTNEETDCFSIHVEPYRNLYVNGYLVHNEEEEEK